MSRDQRTAGFQRPPVGIILPRTDGYLLNPPCHDQEAVTTCQTPVFAACSWRQILRALPILYFLRTVARSRQRYFDGALRHLKIGNRLSSVTFCIAGARQTATYHGKWRACWLKARPSPLSGRCRLSDFWRTFQPHFTH